MNNNDVDAVVQNVLTHLHRCTVVGSVNSIALILGMTAANGGMNPRFKDLRAAFEELGENRRQIFYEAVAAIAEFAVYGSLDFIETYNGFESEDNKEDCPSLSLIYNYDSPDGKKTMKLSECGSEKLGQLFKQISRLDHVKALVDSAINKRIPS